MSRLKRIIDLSARAHSGTTVVSINNSKSRMFLSVIISSKMGIPFTPLAIKLERQYGRLFICVRQYPFAHPKGLLFVAQKSRLSFQPQSRECARYNRGIRNLYSD